MALGGLGWECSCVGTIILENKPGKPRAASSHYWRVNSTATCSQLAEMAGCVGEHSGNMFMRHLGSDADYQGSNLSLLGTLGTQTSLAWLA